MSGTASWTLSSGDVTVEVIATIVGESVVFSYELVSGIADLSGFFIDFGNDGGRITSLGGGNNMRGSDSDGDRLNGFDFAQAIGTVGGNDADTTSGEITLGFAQLAALGLDTGSAEGLLAELATAEIGIRATSVGEDREGSLKLADTGDYTPPAPPEKDWYPEWPQDISNVVLLYTGNNLPDGADSNGDGWFSVKVDGWDGCENEPRDLDDLIVAIHNYIVENFDLANGPVDWTLLLGAYIKGGLEDTAFFLHGFFDTAAGWGGTSNGPLPDPIPAGAPQIVTPPPQGGVDGSAIDAEVAFTDIFDCDQFAFL